MIDITNAKKVKVSCGRGVTDVISIDDIKKPRLGNLWNGRPAWMFYGHSRNTGSYLTPYGIEPQHILEVME